MGKTSSFSSFRHEVGLRIVKLFNLFFIVTPFTVVWFYYYESRLASPYYFWGDVTVVLLFAVLYFLFGKTYDAFLISHYRIFDIVTSQTLSVFLSDCIIYVVMLLLMKHIPNPIPLLMAFVDQVALSIVWAVTAHWIYFKWFPAAKTIIIYDMRRGMKDLIEEYGMAKKFDVKKTASVEECLNDLSMIDDMDVVTADSPHTVDELAQELATIRQSAKKIAIIGSRNLPITHQQMIETLTTALVQQGNTIITSGGSCGTNAAAIRGAMKSNPDKLKVILPQTIGQQPSDVQDQLIGVPNIVEHSDRAMMTLADASRICNREIISQCQQVICFLSHSSSDIVM